MTRKSKYAPGMILMIAYYIPPLFYAGQIVGIIGISKTDPTRYQVHLIGADDKYTGWVDEGALTSPMIGEG